MALLTIRMVLKETYTMLNRFLNRFSMYKVVSFALTILFIISLVLSLFGVLAYSLLAMLASAAVLFVAVYATSLLFGLLFGVRIHAESSFITAMILFFVFTPTLELTGLAGLLITGMIAAASKFVVVFRGRHIFNAAALAIFVAGLTGLVYASWWVGTPVLVPAVFLLGFAVLLKTRRIPSSGTFLGLASVLVVALLVIEGATFGESLVLWLSWPILFFSSFMLTEPLTLPGKRWQQVSEAVVVAFLFAIPLHLGDFTTTPALALLVGNLIAFGFSRHRSLQLTFVEQKQLTPTSYEFVFIPSRPLTHQPGQYVEIQVPHKGADLRGIRRSFSVTSAPGEKTLRLGIKFYEPSSSLKTALQNLKKGDSMPTTGISGDFTLPKDLTAPLLYIAGGIGITPFISHLQHLLRTDQMRDIVLLYSVANIDELAYKDILVASGVKVFVITKSDAPVQLPGDWAHINAPFITQDILNQNVPDVATRTVFISGPPPMIDGTKRHLAALKAPRVKTDYFTGY